MLPGVLPNLLLSGDGVLPGRRDHLRESQEWNKENSGRCGTGDQHVEELTAEGYKRTDVVRALTIAQNDIRMAREILREFATKK